MTFVRAVLDDPSIPLSKRHLALDRIWTDPGIPCRNATPSFWIPDQPSQSENLPLPTEADVVIIGSGISGASVAQALLQNLPQDELKCNGERQSHSRVVMLDAREICGGATGRNGGHILETAEEYAELKRSIGKEAAIKNTEFRLKHLDALVTEAKKLGLAAECQARRVRFLSIYVDEDRWQDAVRDLEIFKQDMPNEAIGFHAINGNIASKKYGLRRAAGIITGPAGAMWPYKFVTGLLSHLQGQHGNSFQAFENTPVLEILRDKPASSLAVKTERGTIFAKDVIHCTNAHVSHLVPALRGRIFPIRGQMSAQDPGPRFGNQGSTHSWLVNYEQGFDYITQLPFGAIGGGEIMVGGGFAQCPWRGIEEIGIATDDDSSLYADVHLSGVLSAVFGDGTNRVTNGSFVKQMWTGNMGFSADGFPWVGSLPTTAGPPRGGDRPSETSDGREWVCAGFSGEGMVHAWLAGKAVAGDLLYARGLSIGDDLRESLEQLPDEMKVSQTRLETSVVPSSSHKRGDARAT